MAKISWHIEPTSKCILECPLCDRTWFYEKFRKRLTNEIDIDHLINFLRGTSPKVNLEGNNGDPIYHSNFLELCKRLKNIKSKITIVTNGSGKKKVWWEKLCSILGKEDTIKFSIDGMEDTNHLYRKNAKWQTIMDAIDVVNKHKIKLVWKYIVFKHNQYQIEDAEILSQQLGFDQFELIKSDRWWKKDLMPDKQYVNDNYTHQKNVTEGTDTYRYIKQDCMSVTDGEPDRMLFIDADGDFYPCCNTANYAFRYKNIFSPKKKKYNIKDNTIKQILESIEVKNFFKSTKNYKTADKCCKIYCGRKEKVV